MDDFLFMEMFINWTVMIDEMFVTELHFDPKLSLHYVALQSDQLYLKLNNTLSFLSYH